jgi:hypothetical protein
MATDELLVDKRIVDRNLASGKLDQADYKARLEALPDLVDNVHRPEDDADSDGESTPAPREGDG